MYRGEAMEFKAIPGPAHEQCGQLLASAPHNPFFTPAYLAARGDSGERPWLLALWAHGRVVAGCTAFETRRRTGRALEIHSAPAVVQERAYWEGLLGFCRERGVQELVLQTYGSPELTIPGGTRELWRRRRREHVWDLTAGNGAAGFSPNHRRNAGRALKAGVELRVAETREACRAHGHLVGASLTRRRERGEAVPSPRSEALWLRLLANGAALIYQGTREGTPLSSALVLLAPEGAYYQSAGTSPEGMAVGASHFVVQGAADDLRRRGIRRFNLGGAGPDEEGLGRFKAGFGARPVELEAAAHWVASPWLLALRRGVQALRRVRGAGVRRPEGTPGPAGAPTGAAAAGAGFSSRGHSA
ncbi:MAG: GNAT family N-acetyltransferase [Deferrisomatales bacterium]|nr:GNAT family N-acetyltransferase [Deferrisomatales bacterium]